MRREELYLRDIIAAANQIAQFVSGIDRETFVNNALIRSAVLQKLTEIGEAAGRISKELRSRHVDVEWTDIVAFRNIAVHAYFAVDWEIVWTTATNDAPSLEKRMTEILEKEFPADQ